MTSYWKHEQLHRGPSRRQSRIQARRVYAEVTESARNAEGHLVCDLCGKPGKDDAMVRDHVVTRGSGGKTSTENVRILCPSCHGTRHLGGHA